jgi:hypothetical protein
MLYLECYLCLIRFLLAKTLGVGSRDGSIPEHRQSSLSLGRSVQSRITDIAPLEL